jgi:hypothetical protein
LAGCHFVIILHFKYCAAALLFIFKNFRIDTGQLNPDTNAILFGRGGQLKKKKGALAPSCLTNHFQQSPLEFPLVTALRLWPQTFFEV